MGVGVGVAAFAFNSFSQYCAASFFAQSVVASASSACAVFKSPAWIAARAASVFSTEAFIGPTAIAASRPASDATVFCSVSMLTWLRGISGTHFAPFLTASASTAVSRSCSAFAAAMMFDFSGSAAKAIVFFSWAWSAFTASILTARFCWNCASTSSASVTAGG